MPSGASERDRIRAVDHKERGEATSQRCPPQNRPAATRNAAQSRHIRRFSLLLLLGKPRSSDAERSKLSDPKSAEQPNSAGQIRQVHGNNNVGNRQYSPTLLSLILSPMRRCNACSQRRVGVPHDCLTVLP